MWLITGPFESEQLGDEDSEKTKLLKTGSTYGVGRHKDSALSINNKKISRQNGEFIVGEHSENDISNEALVPTLALRNTKTSAMKILRGDNVLVVNPDSTHQLETGDTIKLAGTVNAVVTWAPVICFHAPPDLPALDLAACASMGLKLVTKHTRDVTHHLTPSITDPLPPSMLYSLLTPARFVKPEWLVELVRRGADKAGGLEHTYNPPLEKAFRPLIDPSLANRSPAMAKLSAWNPSEDRRALFDGIRFVFAVLGSGAGSITKAMGDVVSRGGADRQFINVEKAAEEQAKGAAGIWGTVLRKRKTVLKEGMRSGLVLVGEEETMTGRGIPKDVKKAWETMVEKARSVQMRVIHPSLIPEAVFKAEVSVLDCVIHEDADADMGEDLPISKSLPDHVPSTHLEELSQLPSMEVTDSPRIQPEDPNAPAKASQTSGAGPSRRLTRRATSQTPAPEPTQPAIPMEVEEEQPAPPRKKPLKRRAKTGGLVNELLGLDDTTVLEVSQDPSQSQPGPPVQDLAPPTHARPGRLKRRVGTAAASSQLFPDLQAEVYVGGDEPPLKKFKALFDQSGQGCGTDQTDEEIFETGDGGVPATQLAAVREEEEEEESHRRPQPRKRKADAMEADEEEGDVVVNIQVTEGSSALRKRAIETMNAVEPSQKLESLAAVKPPSHAATIVKGGAETRKNKGAAPGKPDTDPSFLRAIASTKRGKKTEDDFDREFNKLRITKPDINNVTAGTENAAVQRRWEGLDDFEKDVGIRGNFMQIVEMEVWKDVAQDQPERNMRRGSGIGARMDWDGRQDFKKFRRKMNAPLREYIPLVVREDRAHGQRESYWESTGNNGCPRGFDDLSQSQDHSFSQPKFTQTQTALNSRSKAKPKRKRVVLEELDDDIEVEVEVSGTATRGKARGRAGKDDDAFQKGKKAQGLFDMGSEEDEDTGAGPSATNGGMLTLDNEAEDFDLTLRSTKEPTQAQSLKQKAWGQKRKAVVEDSGSDEGLTFGGFKRAKKRK